MDIMAFELTKIRQKRNQIAKQIHQLRSESTQLSVKEACIKNFMKTYEELMPYSSSLDADDRD